MPHPPSPGVGRGGGGVTPITALPTPRMQTQDSPCEALRNDIQVSAHLNLQEFDSPDTNQVIIDSEWVECFERLRSFVGRPIIVVSGYRTPAHNKSVGGEANSFHLRGMAGDLTWLGLEQKRAVSLAERAGFDGIGMYPDKGSIHADVRGYKARWTKIAGRYV